MFMTAQQKAKFEPENQTAMERRARFTTRVLLISPLSVLITLISERGTPHHKIDQDFTAASHEDAIIIALRTALGQMYRDHCITVTSATALRKRNFEGSSA